MDSSDHTKHTPPEAPPAVVRPGAASERPVGMVEAEWIERDVEDMLNTRGFPEFLERSSDFDTLEITDENKAELNKRFQMFEASKTVARQFEAAMNEKLQRDGKGKINAEERQAFRDHVAELATNDPEKLMELQEDLRALEENPEVIRQKEEELAELKEESLNLEKIRAGMAELTGKKAAIEKSLKDAEKVKFSGWQKFLGQFGRGKQAGLEKQKTEWVAEYDEVAAALREAEGLLKSTPEIIAAHKDSIRKTTDRLSDAQERIFGKCAAAKQIRERLIAETKKKYEDALQSTDLRVLQRAAEQFGKDEELAAAGSDYLNVAPESIADFKTQLNEQVREAMSAEITRALESIPAGVTFSRFERALRKFIELADTEVGFRGKEESKVLVWAALQRAEARATKGSSHKALLRHLIARLSKKGATTTT